MACRSCQKHKSSKDIEAKGFDPQTGKGKCPCGQSYMGAPINTCPRHWNIGLKTPEEVILHLDKTKEAEVVEEKTQSDKLLEDVVEVVKEKPKKATKKTKKKAQKKTTNKTAKKL